MHAQAEEEAGVKYERKWDAVWIRAQDIISEGILISPRMTSDHYTTTLIGALQVCSLQPRVGSSHLDADERGCKCVSCNASAQPNPTVLAGQGIENRRTGPDLL